VATCLRCGGLFGDLFYYKFTVELAGETIGRIREHFDEVRGNMLDCLAGSVRLGTA